MQQNADQAKSHELEQNVLKSDPQKDSGARPESNKFLRRKLQNVGFGMGGNANSVF
jgi:hypothetical protein